MKRRIFLSLCIMLISAQIYAQFSLKPEQKSYISKNNNTINQENSLQLNNASITQKHKFYLGIETSLDYFHFNYDDPYSTLISSEESHGYHFGLKVQYNFNEKLSIRSGLSYSIYYYKSTYQNNGLDIHNFASTYHNGPYIGHQFSKFQFWNFPLMLGYTVFTKEHFKISPSIGLILRINPSFGSLKTYSQLNLGCEYFINNKIFLTIEPYINYYLNIEAIDYFTRDDSKFGLGGIVSINYNL
ncbi:MAG: autotransporter outer membrane beta-barrel domain-containing protein [Bacteroidales bacterium]